MAISITVCNLALSELRAPSIIDIDEDTTESAKCKLFYPQSLKVLLERYEWSFATRIATLAELTDNVRSSEWGHAYALPADIATAKRLVPPNEWPSLSSSVPPWPVNDQPFIIEAGVLYSQIPSVVLEYSISDLDEAVMPAMFIDALAFALAARLAVPLRDDPKLKGQLLQQAEVAAQRAIADDANRQPQRQHDPIDEVAIARAGGAGAFYGRC